MPKRKGKRAKKSVYQWAVGDRCLATFDNEPEPFAGEVRGLFNEGATVFVVFDDGDEQKLSADELVPEPIDEDDDPGESGGGLGFNQYPVQWREDLPNFHVKVEGAKFYGNWRRTTLGDSSQKPEAYAIDMWAEYKGKTYTVNSIYYGDGNPMDDMLSLNRDICAAINLFIYMHLDGDAAQLDDLQKKARRPVVHIKRLETVDRLLVRLREFRDLCCRSGGQRLFAIKGDGDDDPVMGLVVDITTQASAMDGKPPSLEMGAVFDVTVAGGKAKDAKMLDTSVSKATVMELCQELVNCKDKRRARQLRGSLRRLGHRGGARAIMSQLETQAEEV